jgi:hypothetical protein
MNWPVISSNPDVQSRYVSMRERGESHNFAEMAATRSSPGLNGTETAFFRGKHLNQGLEDNFMGERMRKLARRAGISIEGKVFIGQMADKRGAEDPRAWVSSPSEIKAWCEKTGAACDGLVKVKGSPPPPPVQVRLAEDIVQEKMQEYLVKDPSRAADIRSLREEIIEKHGAKKDDVNFAPESETKPKGKIIKAV